MFDNLNTKLLLITSYRLKTIFRPSQSAEMRSVPPVQCGSARHADFRKGVGGAPAAVSGSPLFPCGALAGPMATERRGR